MMPNRADRLLLDTSNQRTLPFTLDELKAMRRGLPDWRQGLGGRRSRHLDKSSVFTTECYGFTDVPATG